MNIPKHIQRFPTKKAIDSLAKRFNLPNSPFSQDWEWEVADSSRINEFISAYESNELDDDERFTLMETIIQSFEELQASLSDEPRWIKVLSMIENNIELHIHSVWYWADIENDDKDNEWRVSAFMRMLLKRYKNQFAQHQA